MDIEPRRPQSGLVTAMAVVNLLYGGIGILCGLGVAFFMNLIASFFGGAVAADPDAPGARDAAGAFGMLAAFGAVMGIIIILVAGLWILAGVGLLKRRQWGRIITLVLAVITGILAVLSLFGGDLRSILFGLIVYGGYTALAFAALWSPPVGEFA
jgi:hypothetical protein